MIVARIAASVSPSLFSTVCVAVQQYIIQPSAAQQIQKEHVQNIEDIFLFSWFAYTAIYIYIYIAHTHTHLHIHIHT